MKGYSQKELDRAELVMQIENGKITQRDAARMLGISERQMRRITKRFRRYGMPGIKRIRVESRRKFSEDFRKKVIKLLEERYPTFGPKLAGEMLEEEQGLKVNRETIRQWMQESGLWKGKVRRKSHIHQSRERRPCFGELVQIDGSPHDWFEGRAEKCCLLVAIDDATSVIVAAHFVEAESSLGYMNLIKKHVEEYGRPVAYYSDKHSIFKTTKHECVDGRLEDTQVHRAMRELGIQLICASSPQAKGRVERANQTLQDRLIKMMSLKGISSIEEGNKFLPSFIKKHNEKFAVSPANPQEMHKPAHLDQDALRRILSTYTTRKLTKNLEFSLNGQTYQIKTKTHGRRLMQKAIKIHTHMDGKIEVWADNTPLEFSMLPQAFKVYEADSKEINIVMDRLYKDMGHNALATQELHS